MKRIVIVSEDLAPPWDRETAKFAWSVGRVLAMKYDVRLINVDRNGTGGENEKIRRVPGTRTFMTPSLRREIRSFTPDTVLYVPSSSSTTGSFVRAYALRRHAPRAAHGMVALIPRRHRAAERPILHGTAPDVLFVGSYRSLLHTHLLSLNGDLIPAGVDASAYRPPRAGERVALRETLGVEAGSYVYLHVGRVGPRRNLDRLAALAETPGASVIVVAVDPPADQRLQSRLERAGVRVVHGPVPVAEYYRAADCYVFPVEDHGEEGEIPLGVFEALASGVPVVSTPFGGLRDFLPPGDDLRYIESDDELLAAVSQLREQAAPAVRSMDDFSWERVAQRIVKTLGP